MIGEHVMDGQVDPRTGPGSTGSYSRRNNRASAQDWFGEQRPPAERPSTIDQFFDRSHVEPPARVIRTPQSLTLLPGSSHSTRRSPPSAPTMSNNDYGRKEGQWDRRGSFPGAGRGNHSNYRSHPPTAAFNQASQYNARNEDRRYPHHDNGNPSAPHPHHSLTRTNASLDPRRIGRTDAGRPPGPNTDHNPPGQREASGVRSGSQTPMTPHSVTSSHDDRIKDLTAVLDEFTSHVTSMASLTIQRDMAKKEYEKREQDYHLSRKHHAAFSALAEQQENSKVRAQKKFEELDQQLRNHVAAREKLSTAIASKVISHSNSKDSESLKRLESGYEELADKARNTKSEICQIKYLYQKVLEHGKLLGSIQDELDKMRPALTLGDSLVSKLDKLESRVNDFPNLRMELSKIRDEVKPISKSMDKVMANMERLNQTVGVEGDDHGLIRAVKQLEASSAEFYSGIEKLDVDQDKHDTELDQHDARISALEARNNAHNEQASSDAQHDPATSGVGSSSDVTRLEADLEAFRAEQQTRDEMVAEEIEKTQKVVNKLENDFKNFEAQIEQMNGWIDDHSPERPVIDDRRPSVNGLVEDEAKSALNTTSISNGVQANPETDQEVKKIKDELEQQQHWQSEFRHQMDGFKYSIEILDMRFNKLTTEHLARYMVGQLSKIYPQASAILASFDESRHFQELMQTKIQEFSDRLEKIKSEQEEQKAAVTTIPAATTPAINGASHDDTYSKAETDQMIGELRSYVLEMIDLSKNTAQQMHDLKLRVKSIWDSTAKEFGTLFVQVEALKEQQQQQQQTDGGSNPGGGSSTRPTSEGASAGTGQGANTAPARKASTTTTDTPASYGQSPPTRHQSVSNANSGATKAATTTTTTNVKPGGKKKGRKRKRDVVSESESDWRQRFDDEDDGGSGSD